MKVITIVISKLLIIIIYIFLYKILLIGKYDQKRIQAEKGKLHVLYQNLKDKESKLNALLNEEKAS